MKTKINIWLLAFIIMTSACVGTPQATTEDVYLLDDTDILRSKPDLGQIVRNYQLKSDPWQSIAVNVTFITNKDIASMRRVTLEPESRLLGNKQLRTAKVDRFSKELQKALAMKATSTLEHSIIYRTIATNLNYLRRSTASNRRMIIYSDLMENAEVNFYDPRTISLLRSKPKIVQAALESEVVLGELKGIEVWLVYDPQTYEANNTYMAVANFYKNLLESKGARVYIVQSFTLR